MDNDDRCFAPAFFCITSKMLETLCESPLRSSFYLEAIAAADDPEDAYNDFYWCKDEF